jgi:hypothetical protein
MGADNLVRMLSLMLRGLRTRLLSDKLWEMIPSGLVKVSLVQMLVDQYMNDSDSRDYHLRFSER